MEAGLYLVAIGISFQNPYIPECQCLYVAKKRIPHSMRLERIVHGLSTRRSALAMRPCTQGASTIVYYFVDMAIQKTATNRIHTNL